MWPALIGRDLEEMQLLHVRFPGCVISRNDDQNWPPRPCILTPSYIFLWGFVKSSINANQPSTSELKEKIQWWKLKSENVIRNISKRARIGKTLHLLICINFLSFQKQQRRFRRILPFFGHYEYDLTKFEAGRSSNSSK